MNCWFNLWFVFPIPFIFNWKFGLSFSIIFFLLKFCCDLFFVSGHNFYQALLSSNLAWTLFCSFPELVESVYSKETLPTLSCFFCLEVACLITLHTIPIVSKGQTPCKARKPRRSSGWAVPCCPTARCAEAGKDHDNFLRVAITYCYLPEAFTNGIVAS